MKNNSLHPEVETPTAHAGARQDSTPEQAAPERIWAWTEDDDFMRAKPHGVAHAVEYIRADLIQDADMAECAAFFAGYEAGEADGRAVQATRLTEVRYELEWLSGARPPAHPEPMKGKASFDSAEDALAFLKRQASDAKALSLTRVEVSTMRTDLRKLLAPARLDRHKEGA